MYRDEFYAASEALSEEGASTTSDTERRRGVGRERRNKGERLSDRKVEDDEGEVELEGKEGERGSEFLFDDDEDIGSEEDEVQYDSQLNSKRSREARKLPTSLHLEGHKPVTSARAPLVFGQTQPIVTVLPSTVVTTLLPPLFTAPSERQRMRDKALAAYRIVRNSREGGKNEREDSVIILLSCLFPFVFHFFFFFFFFNNILKLLI
jgi:hypothetical protein